MWFLTLSENFENFSESYDQPFDKLSHSAFSDDYVCNIITYLGPLDCHKFDWRHQFEVMIDSMMSFINRTSTFRSGRICAGNFFFQSENLFYSIPIRKNFDNNLTQFRRRITFNNVDYVLERAAVNCQRS